MNTLKQYSKKQPHEILEIIKFIEPPFNPFKIIEKIKIEIKKNLDFNNVGFDGEIYLTEKNYPEIWINPTNDIFKQKATLAHEIGHLIFDILPNLDDFRRAHDNGIFKDDYKTLRSDGSENFEETRANEYGANLLMPKSQIIKYGTLFVEQFGKDESLIINKLADKFEVSPEDMKRRLINIGAI